MSDRITLFFVIVCYMCYIMSKLCFVFWQVKNYDEWLQTSIANTLSRIRNPSTGNNVLFTPSSLIQDAIKEGNKYEGMNIQTYLLLNILI